MSVPEVSKTTNTQNESATNINPIQPGNTNPAIIDTDPVKKETDTPRPITLAKSKEVLCIDMESVIAPQVRIRDQLETGALVNLSELTAQMISQREERRKISFKGLYDYIVGTGRQSQAPRSIWAQGQTYLQPEQAVWMQYGPTQIQIPPQSPLGGPNQVEGPMKPTSPQFIQAQGGNYPGPPQGGNYPGPPQNQGYPQPQSHTYPPQGQPYYPPAPQQGYFGNPPPPPQQPTLGGFFGYPNDAVPVGERFVYDPATRNSFVRLVMFIVFIMFLITALTVAAVYFTPPANTYFKKSRWEIMIIAIVSLMIANYGLVCYPCGRGCPGNGILLVLAVIGMTLIVCQVTCRYRVEIIMYALIATAVVVLICVMLACTSFDFTSYALYIILASAAISIVIMIVILVSQLTGQMMKPLMIVLLIVSTLVQVFVLTMELQMVIGGGAIQISETDYALAAFMIYMSIIEIFLNIVRLLGLLDN